MTWEQVVTLIMSPVIATAVSWLFNRDVKDQVKSQGSEITELKDRRVSAIEEKLDRHVSGDKSQEVLTKVGHIEKQLDQFLAKMDLSRDDIATLKANREDDRGYIENLDKSLQKHKGDGHGHA